MTSLVLELQHEALTPQARVSDLLRKALVVATKLELSEFRQWIEHELKGYEKKKVPPYRHVRGQVKVFNPYHGWQPVVFEDSRAAEIYNGRDIAQPIGELESLLKEGKGTLQVPLPDTVTIDIARSTAGLPPTLLVDSSEVIGIVDGVRSAILEWALKLEKDNILGEGMTFSKAEKAQAAAAIYHIQNFTGVMGTVHTNTIQIGDYNSIHAELKKLGIPQEDRVRLESIMDQVKDAKGEERKGLVSRGIEWVLEHGPQLGNLADSLKQWFELLRG